jgi:hypothetical protein
VHELGFDHRGRRWSSIQYLQLVQIMM